MQVAHLDQIPVFVGANPTIKALIAVRDALVSRVVVSVGVMCACVISEKEICFTDPIHLEEYSKVDTSIAHRNLPGMIPAPATIAPAAIRILKLKV